MRRHLATLALVLTVLSLLAGCGDDGDGGDVDAASTTTTAPEDPIEGRTFDAVSLEGETTRTLLPNSTLQIGFADGEITVETGCNRLTGSYHIEDVSLEVDALEGTERPCPTPELTDQETWFTGMVTGRPVITATPPDGVVLVHDREKLTLEVPTEETGAAAALVGPTWTLATIVDGESIDSVPVGVTATLTFAADGTYQVAAGCNTGSGTYAEAGADIYTVDPPALTRKRCEDEAMAVESAVVAALDGEVGMSVQDDRLTITVAEDGTGLGFEAG